MASSSAVGTGAAGASPEAANDAEFSLRVEDRSSLELVIAFVGPVGSGVTTAAETLKAKLEDQYGYTVEHIKVSSLIRRFATEVGDPVDDTLLGSDRIAQYQTVGNKLRNAKGSHYLADRVIEKIAFAREKNEGFAKAADGMAVPLPKRAAYIVDSLKNPAEVQRLKQIYGDLFWLVTVFAPHKVRERRLCYGGLDDLMARQVMKRDQEEEENFGQKVSRTAHLGDYFIRNHTDTRTSLEASVNRFLEVVFSTGLHTPTFEERGMMKAAAAAIQSACMSRQVGAAIYSSAGELLGVGCNDVPMHGGGLYSEVPGREDNRCYKWGGNVCHNDERKQRLARTITKAIAGDQADSPTLVTCLGRCPIPTQRTSSNFRGRCTRRWRRSFPWLGAERDQPSAAHSSPRRSPAIIARGT